MTDAEIRETLEAIDQDDDAKVSSWEARFLENLVYTYKGKMSKKQRECALKILEKYPQT